MTTQRRENAVDLPHLHPLERVDVERQRRLGFELMTDRVHREAPAPGGLRKEPRKAPAPSDEADGVHGQVSG